MQHLGDPINENKVATAREINEKLMQNYSVNSQMEGSTQNIHVYKRVCC